MKKKYLSVLFVFILLNINLKAQKIKSNSNQKRHSNLEYIESSNGLNVPQLDGGRTELEFADINGDGNIDLLSIGDHGSPNFNTDEHGIMVWFGDGNGNWDLYENGDFGYGGIAVGDVNNDGLLDVGYAMHHNYSSNDFGDQLIEVALGDGSGMYWSPWDNGLASNGESWGMFCTDFADVDNDGYLDIGANSFGCCDGVHIYLNQNDGNWIQSFGFTGGNSEEDFYFGDINNDGNADFAVGQGSGSVYFGDGTGNFVLNDVNLPPTNEIGLKGIALGDVNNDGGKDLSFISIDGAIEIWIWNNEQNLWVNFSGNLPTSGDYEATQLYDMNVDGYVDVCAFGNGIFTLWLGDGSGDWTQDAQFNISNPSYCKAFRVGRDIDHNGFPDIALVNDEGSWPSEHNYLHCFKESSTAENLTINPMFPRGNEKFIHYSVQFIDWISAVPNNDSSNVKLEYSTSGNNGPWILIADNLPNNGRYQWTMPDVVSSNCYIRYTVWTETDTTTSITASSFTICGPTKINNILNQKKELSLHNYPNPFKSKTTILFYLFKNTKLEISIYNLKGEKVKTLIPNIEMGKGIHTITWNGKDDNGNNVSSGIYYDRLIDNDYIYAGKIILLK